MLSFTIEANSSIRVFLNDIKNALVSRRKFQIRLVDVTSLAEYSGQITAPPEYRTEYVQRGGHTAGAEHIRWAYIK